MSKSPLSATVVYGSLNSNVEFIKEMLSYDISVYHILQYLKVSSKSGGNYASIEKLIK